MTMGKYAGKGTELRGTAWQFPEAAAGRLLFMHFIRQLCCRNRQRGKSVENKEEHMAIFEGAGVAIITPFHEDGSVNYEKFGEHIEAQIAGGTDAIIVCGTTGEASTLTHEEHLEVIRFCVEQTAGRIPVIAGTGSNCTESAVWMSKEAQEVEEDGFEMPDEIETNILVGDLFEITDGEITHRLLCGDSTDSDAVAKLMNEQKADLVFTDPDFSMPFDLLKEAYSNAVIFSKGFGFWVCADKQAVQLAMNDFDNFSHFFIQDFRQATMVSGTQAMTRHVMICKFGNRKMNNLKDGFRTILEIATLRTTKDHEKLPMQKRVELPAAFIEHYMDKGNIVLDLFGHSGSTMVAAQQLGVNCYMQELEPKYCQSILDRMQSLDENILINKVA